MNHEPQAPLWPEKEISTIGKRNVSGEIVAGVETARAITFGEKLKRERELRSITLDEIANSTKIGTRLLHALEDEEFSKLPGGIFNKGFVRAYAKYLGLDEEQAVVDYLAAEAEQERKRRAPFEPESSKQGPAQLIAIQGGARPDNVYNIRASVEVVEQQPDQAGGFLMAAVILVFILGIGGFGWKYYSTHSTTNAAATPEDSPAKPAATPAQLQTPAPAQTQTTSQPTSAPNIAASSTPAPTALNLNPPVAIEKVAPNKPETLANNTSPLDTPSVATPAEFILDLRADEDSWAQITADGKQLWSGVVFKDVSKSFHATKQLVIRLGNAPGVQLSYNGKPLPRFSQDSQSGTKTRTFIFTPEGLASR